MRTRKIITRIVRILMTRRRVVIVVHTRALMINELLLVTVWKLVFVFAFALVLGNGIWVRVGKRTRNRLSSARRTRKTLRPRGDSYRLRERGRRASLRARRRAGQSGGYSRTRSIGTSWIREALSNDLSSGAKCRNRGSMRGGTGSRRRGGVPSSITVSETRRESRGAVGTGSNEERIGWQNSDAGRSRYCNIGVTLTLYRFTRLWTYLRFTQEPDCHMTMPSKVTS
jgi:hypothetical protein